MPGCEPRNAHQQAARSGKDDGRRQDQVQARDGQQVGEPQACEGGAGLGRQAAQVAQRQGPQEGAAGTEGLEAPSGPAPQPMQGAQRIRAPVGQAQGQGRVDEARRGADPDPRRLPGITPAAGVAHAARGPHAQAQAPALAGQRLVEGVLGPRGVEEQAPGHGRLPGHRVGHVPQLDAGPGGSPGNGGDAGLDAGVEGSAGGGARGALELPAQVERAGGGRGQQRQGRARGGPGQQGPEQQGRGPRHERSVGPRPAELGGRNPGALGRDQERKQRGHTRTRGPGALLP